MPQTWIADEGLTGLSDQVGRISDELAGARRNLAGAGTGDLGWLADRYTTVVDQCVDALQTASAATSETADKVIDCDRLYRDTDGNVELWFTGLEA